jgi:hypothetical protein
METPIPVPGSTGVVPEQPPLADPAVFWALAGGVAEIVRLIGRRRMHLPSQRRGMLLRFCGRHLGAGVP